MESVSQSKILKKSGIKARKKMKIPKRTETQKIEGRTKCGNLYLKNPNVYWILDDESYLTLSHSKINGKNLFYTSNIDATSPEVKYNEVSKYKKKLLVWVCISELGVSAPIFRESGMAVNADVYLDIIKRGLVPFIGKYHLNNDYKFWPDLASSHYANKVVDYYRAQNINFVEKSENPANVPEARPIEDFWAILKGEVYKGGWKTDDFDVLKKKIRLCLRKMDQNLVQDLIAGTSARLNKIRNDGFIEKR